MTHEQIQAWQVGGVASQRREIAFRSAELLQLLQLPAQIGGGPRELLIAGLSAFQLDQLKLLEFIAQQLALTGNGLHQLLTDGGQGLPGELVTELGCVLVLIPAVVDVALHAVDAPAGPAAFSGPAGRVPQFQRDKSDDPPGRGFELGTQVFHHARELAQRVAHCVQRIGVALQDSRGFVQGHAQAQEGSQQADD